MIEINELNKIWMELRNESKLMRSLIVRNTGIPGLAIAFDPISNSNKIHIRVEEAWSDGMFPNWSGLDFSTEYFDVAGTSLPHIILQLVEDDFEEIFSFFCRDLIENIEHTIGDERDGKIQETVNSWNQFFLSSREKLLSREMQQGLFAELDFLIILLNSAKMTKINAVNSWKGGERAYHDFQFENRVVEVKSTSSKEPKKVRISNEKQLNDSGLDLMSLLATDLTTVDGGKELGDLFNEICDLLSGEDITRDKFIIQLIKYGLSPDEFHKYKTGYNVLQRQFFTVGDDFPRIISCPDGIGDLKYSITVNSCLGFETSQKNALEGYVDGQ